MLLVLHSTKWTYDLAEAGREATADHAALFVLLLGLFETFSNIFLQYVIAYSIYQGCVGYTVHAVSDPASQPA